jgi:hypothetical protein
MHSLSIVTILSGIIASGEAQTQPPFALQNFANPPLGVKIALAAAFEKKREVAFCRKISYVLPLVWPIKT